IGSSLWQLLRAEKLQSRLRNQLLKSVCSASFPPTVMTNICIGSLDQVCSLCSRRLHVSYQSWCELAFQFFNRVGPLEWFGGLVVVGNEVQDGLLKLIKATEMVGLEEFALQQTEPNFDLIEPGGIGRQPIELYPQFSIQHRRSFL